MHIINDPIVFLFERYAASFEALCCYAPHGLIAFPVEDRHFVHIMKEA